MILVKVKRQRMILRVLSECRSRAQKETNRCHEHGGLPDDELSPVVISSLQR